MLTIYTNKIDSDEFFNFLYRFRHIASFYTFNNGLDYDHLDLNRLKYKYTFESPRFISNGVYEEFAMFCIAFHDLEFEDVLDIYTKKGRSTLNDHFSKDYCTISLRGIYSLLNIYQCITNNNSQNDLQTIFLQNYR